MSWQRVLEEHDGVMQRRVLVQAGLTSARLRAEVTRGRWRSPVPGVVVGHNGPLTQRQRWRLALAYAGDDAVLSHQSAAALYSLRVVETRVHVTVPHGRHRRPCDGVVIHQSARPSLRMIARLPCTTAARTVLDVAGATADRQAVAALVSDAVQRGIVSIADVAAELEHCPRRGRLAVRQIVADVAAGVRSAGEVRFRQLVRAAGITTPEWNAVVGRFRVDALWREAGVVVEIDGARWHLDAASWERDLRRANALQASGLRILRFSVRQLRDEPQFVVATLRAALRTS